MTARLKRISGWSHSASASLYFSSAGCVRLLREQLVGLVVERVRLVWLSMRDALRPRLVVGVRRRRGGAARLRRGSRCRLRFCFGAPTPSRCSADEREPLHLRPPVHLALLGSSCFTRASFCGEQRLRDLRSPPWLRRVALGSGERSPAARLLRGPARRASAFFARRSRAAAPRSQLHLGSSCSTATAASLLLFARPCCFASSAAFSAASARLTSSSCACTFCRGLGGLARLRRPRSPPRRPALCGLALGLRELARLNHAPPAITTPSTTEDDVEHRDLARGATARSCDAHRSRNSRLGRRQLEHVALGVASASCAVAPRHTRSLGLCRARPTAWSPGAARA